MWIPRSSSAFCFATFSAAASRLFSFLCRLDERDDGDAIQNYLEEKTGQRTVPSIFVRE